ncbi:MAG: large subunit ribosomal protein L1 [Verrucomicrobiales bacterium]|jgi:large subunit ribosomal protein L1
MPARTAKKPMPKKRSKRYQQAAKLVDADKTYSLGEACAIIGKFPTPKFDQSVTISFRIGVDPRKSDQMIRGTCPLPHGSGQEVRVLVFAEGDAAAAATAAGAEFVGYEDLIKKVAAGFQDFDVAVATPAAMSEVRKLGRFLGPRGLMPNPKTGTVTDDTAEAIKAVKAGRVDFKLDKNGNIAVVVGKASFDPKLLEENASAVIDSILAVRPATAKGRLLTSGAVAATMSPGVKLDVNSLESI